MLTAALLTLTLTADGGLRMSLTEMESEAACMAAHARVTEILTQSGIEAVEAICGETDLRLTPFEHGADPEDEKHLYRVRVTGDEFVVAPQAPNEVCTDTSGDGFRIYCARSAQSVVSAD